MTIYLAELTDLVSRHRHDRLPVRLLPFEPGEETVLVNQDPPANANDRGFQFVLAHIEKQPAQTAFTESRISG